LQSALIIILLETALEAAVPGYFLLVLPGWPGGKNKSRRRSALSGRALSGSATGCRFLSFEEIIYLVGVSGFSCYPVLLTVYVETASSEISGLP
jgi:hypothetical protein